MTTKDKLYELRKRVSKLNSREDIEHYASKLEDMVIALEDVRYKEHYLELKHECAIYARLCLEKRKECKSRVRNFNLKNLDLGDVLDTFATEEEKQNLLSKIELEVANLEYSYDYDLTCIIDGYSKLIRYFLDFGLNVGNVHALHTDLKLKAY